MKFVDDPTTSYWTDRKVWITGASSGLGWSLAEELADRGAHLVLSARREEKLNELAGKCSDVETLVEPLDVTDPSANREVAESIKTQWGCLDTVILNAGISELNAPGEFDAESIERVHEVNYLGMVYGIDAALDMLDRSEDPNLVGISSASAYGALPGAGAYGTSKAAQKYLLESLQFDLKPKDIRVTVVCPGFIKTPLVEKNDFPMPFLMEPEQAARKIADGLARNKLEIHFPKPLTLFTKLVSKFPGWLYRFCMRRLVPPGEND